MGGTGIGGGGGGGGGGVGGLKTLRKLQGIIRVADAPTWTSIRSAAARNWWYESPGVLPTAAMIGTPVPPSDAEKLACAGVAPLSALASTTVRRLATTEVDTTVTDGVRRVPGWC